MNLLKKKVLIILAICTTLSFLVSNIALANDDYETGTILPECIESGNCSLCDILKTFANFADFMISVVGSVALLFFLYGGYVWISSAGNHERIKRGKNILVSTIVGIILVMGAWQIINFTISAFVSSSPTAISFKLFTNQPWYQYCDQSLACVNKDEGESCGEYLECNEQGLCVTTCSRTPGASCLPEGSFCEITNVLDIKCPNNGICCQITS